MSVAGVKGRSRGRGAMRIVMYYVVFVGVAAAILWYFPSTRDLLTFGAEELTSTPVAEIPPVSPAEEITRTLGGGSTLAGTLVESREVEGISAIWVTAVSVLGALLIMIPVALSYILIKRETGYQESVVHTLLILPVAVAGIVIVVKSSIALAFSLAGIVAAVRFRTTLEDTKDAVYVFLAIGVGLAAGDQKLQIALALSVVFNAVNLILWRMNFGNIYADQIHRTGGLGLGTAIAGPASTRSAVGFGEKSAMEAVQPSSLEEVTRAQERMKRYLMEETAITKERKRYSALLLYTRDVATVQEIVEPALNQWALRWQLAEVVPSESGVSAITYLIRLKEGFDEAELIRVIEASDDDYDDIIEAAEIRSLKGLASEK